MGHRIALNGPGGIGKTQIALEYASRHGEEYTTILWLKADTREKLQEDARECARLLNLLPPEKPVNEEQLLQETRAQLQQDRSSHDSAGTGSHQQNQTPPGKIWLPPGLSRLRKTKEHQQEMAEKVDPVQLLKNWLGTNTQWLLILDNVEEPNVLRDILPGQRDGHILLTTQQRSLGVQEEPIPVEQVTPDQGAEMLLNRARLLDTTKQTRRAQKENQYFAQKLSELVGGLPLALDQAGAYIYERQITVKEYVTLFHEKSAELLKRRGTYLAGEHGEDIYGVHLASVISTFEISFDRIKEIDPIAASLLRICAFLDTDDIPEEIFMEAIHVLSAPEKILDAGKIEDEESINILWRYSLLQRNLDGKLYTIHRLLPIALKDPKNIPADQQQSWAEKTITILNHAPIALKDDKQPTEKNEPQRSRTQLYLAHTRACVAHIKKWDIRSADAVELLNRAGAYMYQQREYAQAQQFYEHLLQIKKKVQDTSNLDRARTLSILANLLYQQKDEYVRAEHMYQEAIAIVKLELAQDDPHDPHVGQILSYYALLLRRLKEHRKKAEELAILANKIHTGMTDEANKRWFGRWAGFHSVEEYEKYAGFGALYFAVIGIPVIFGLLLQSWLWGVGSLILILFGMTASFLGNKYAFPDKNRVLRIVWIFFFLSLIGIIGSGAWMVGKNLLILWPLAHWPLLLQFALQGVCVLVAAMSFVAAMAITDELITFPKYTIMPTFTMTVSLYALPILSGLLLHSWGMFGLLLFVTWSFYLSVGYIISQNAIPRYRTLVACLFGCIWGYMGWIFAGFLNFHISGYTWQPILPYLLAVVCSLLGFICHTIAFANLNFIGGENSTLVLEDLWVDADAATILDTVASEPINSWELFYLTLARGYREKRRYADAIDCYTRLIAYTPDTPFYYSFRANTYQLQGDYTNAIADFSKDIDLHSKVLDAADIKRSSKSDLSFTYYNRGYAYYMQHDYPSAIADFNEAIRLDPMSVSAYHFLGYASIGQGDYTNAIASSNEAIRLDPNDALNYDDRGKAYFLQNNYSLALADFDKAIALNPTYALAYHNRGHIYSLQNNYPLALADFDKAIALNPTYALTYYKRAYVHSMQKDYPQALVDYTRAIELDPQYVPSYYERGDTYYMRNNYPLAITDYTKALELDSHNATVYNRRGTAYLGQSDYSHALADYEQTLKLDPQYAPAYNNLGYVYDAQGSYVLAIINYTKAIDLDSSDAGFYSNRGYTYVKQGDYPLALTDFDTAIKLDPQLDLAYNGRGNVFFNQGDYALAIINYNQALQIEPQYVFAYINRGNTYYSQNDYARAISDYDKALTLNPNNTLVYARRGNAYYLQGDYTHAVIDYDKALTFDPQKEADIASTAIELPEKQEADTLASGGQPSQPELQTEDSSFVQNEYVIDAKAVLARVEQRNVPPSWQVYANPNVLLGIKHGAYFFGICTGLLVGAVLAVANLLHLSWLLWILPAAIAFEVLCIIAARIVNKKTQLVILPEGFVYRHRSNEPAFLFHYQTVSEIKVKALEITLVLTSGKEQKLSLEVSEAGLRSLKNTYLAFKTQSNPQTVSQKTETPFVPQTVSMDGKTILERVKQGKNPPTWQIYTDPHILTSTFGAASILAFFSGIIVAVVVILVALLHFPWHLWLLWLSLASIILVVLLTIVVGVGAKKTKLIILPEGFVYTFMYGELDFSFYFDSLSGITLQEKKVTVILTNGEQQTTSLSVSREALQHLLNAYLAFKNMQRTGL